MNIKKINRTHQDHNKHYEKNLIVEDIDTINKLDYQVFNSVAKLNENPTINSVENSIQINY